MLIRVHNDKIGADQKEMVDTLVDALEGVREGKFVSFCLVAMKKGDGFVRFQASSEEGSFIDLVGAMQIAMHELIEENT